MCDVVVPELATSGVTSACLRAIRARLQRVELMEAQRASVLAIVDRLSGEALARELEVIEIALSARAGRAADALRCFEMLHDVERGWSAGGYEVRRALVASVAAGQRTWLSALEAADELRRAPASERDDAIVRLCRPPKPMDRAHAVYVAAASVAAPEALPPGPPHRGGPLPLLDARAHADLATWLAERVGPLLSSKEELAYARRVRELARAARAGRPVDQAIRSLGKPMPKARVLRVVLAPLIEALCVQRTPDRAGTAVRDAAAVALRLLGTTPARATRFLLALDDEILRLDCSAACERLASPPGRNVRRALWRGNGKSGEAALWIMQLDGGTWALLAELGGRWTLVQGSPDDVLASVPNERFDEAVRATASSRAEGGALSRRSR